MRLSPAVILDRLDEALDEHERVSRWLRESPRDSRQRRVFRNRQWEIKRRMNRYCEEIVERGLHRGDEGLHR